MLSLFSSFSLLCRNFLVFFCILQFTINKLSRFISLSHPSKTCIYSLVRVLEENYRDSFHFHIPQKHASTRLYESWKKTVSFLSRPNKFKAELQHHQCYQLNQLADAIFLFRDYFSKIENVLFHANPMRV